MEALRLPWRSRTWFPVSTKEWMPSENMAELPVIKAAANLVTAMRLLPARAAYMTFFEEDIYERLEAQDTG